MKIPTQHQNSYQYRCPNSNTNQLGKYNISNLSIWNQFSKFDDFLGSEEINAPAHEVPLIFFMFSFPSPISQPIHRLSNVFFQNWFRCGNRRENNWFELKRSVVKSVYFAMRLLHDEPISFNAFPCSCVHASSDMNIVKQGQTDIGHSKIVYLYEWLASARLSVCVWTVFVHRKTYVESVIVVFNGHACEYCVCVNVWVRTCVVYSLRTIRVYVYHLYEYELWTTHHQCACQFL